MLRRFSLLIIIALLSVRTIAQIKPAAIALRQVSGIVTDSADNAIIGASVTLSSKTDTLKTTTNEEGLFFFTNVKAWEFTLSVNAIGYRGFVKIGKYNDASPRLTLDPVVLRSSDQVLKEVVIRTGPSIIYKVDTVEYRASDYVVREGANIAELLNKMDGMIVDSDGSLIYNGNKVDKAKLNGREFLAGDVPTVTKNLPAEIVEKVQIIDDYGDQAARTGVKDGDPKKLLNITTKADRSIGHFARVNGGAGNDERYEGNVLGTKINANRNYTLSLSTSNTINGVPSGSSFGMSPQLGGESGGNTRKKGAILTYRDQWGKKTQVNANYSYNNTDINSINSSVGQNFSTNGTTFSTNESNVVNKSGMHNLKVELESDLDSSNYIKLTPNFSYSSGNAGNTSSAFLTGILRQNQIAKGSGINKVPTYGLSVLYIHNFKNNRRRNYSVLVNGSNRLDESDREQNTNITYFDLLTNAVLKDSLVRRMVERNNEAGNYNANITYSEPVGTLGSLSLGAQINYNKYNNRATTSNLSAAGMPSLIDSLSNIFDYSFAQTRLAVRYQTYFGKYSINAGIMGIPTVLSGKSQSLGTSVKRTSFNILPVFRFSYAWRREETLSVNYSGSVTEPRFDQVQPVRDVSDPQNIVVGNPGLKLAVTHTLSSNYDTYMPNSRFGFNAGLSAVFYNNRVITNNVQVADAYNSFKYERRFANLSGSYRLGGNYSVSKALSNRKYSFFFMGNVDRRYDKGINNNQSNSAKQWIFTERLGSRMTPVTSIEINPSVSYNFSSSDNTLPGAIDSKIKIWSLNLEGRYTSPHSWWIRYSADKKFIKGISYNQISNPLVVNTSFGIDMTKKKTFTVSLSAFDVLNQNKFLNRNITETSITDTRTNLMSRYFMANLSFNLQRWKGTPMRDGVPRARRGDGSFIF